MTNIITVIKTAAAARTAAKFNRNEIAYVNAQIAAAKNADENWLEDNRFSTREAALTFLAAARYMIVSGNASSYIDAERFIIERNTAAAQLAAK